MKKAFTLVLAFMISSLIYSQTYKGYWLAGGSVSFTKTKLEPAGTEYSTFTMNPRVGYFLIDHLAVGLNIHTSNFTSKSRTAGTAKSTEVAAGPFARYYFLNSGDRFNVFVDGSVVLGTGKLSGTNTSTEKVDLFIYRFAGGPVFYFTPNVALELNTGYQSIRYSSTSNETSWNNNLFFGIGFQVHLTNSE